MSVVTNPSSTNPSPLTPPHTPSHDWSALPRDILKCIFSHFFSSFCFFPRELEDIFSTYVELSLVCRHWNSALRAEPPSLSVVINSSSPPYLLHTWLPSFPVHQMRLSAVDDYFRREDLPSDNKDLQHELDLPLQPRELMNFSALKVLSIDASWSSQGPKFECAHLTALPELTRLRLDGYLEYDLEGLPPSVRWLTLGYGQYPRSFFYDSHQFPLTYKDIFIVPPLPDRSNGQPLEKLCIEADGVIGLSMDRLWDSCFEIDIKAAYVLIGVPIADESIIISFERPYREGAYVPPHILGDWDAVEASNAAAHFTASEFLLGLTRCQALRSICFSDECAKSIKMVPGRAGRLAEANLWLHSITHQATHLLFGMSSRELQNLVKDLQSAGLLSHDAINICFKDVYLNTYTVKIGNCQRVLTRGRREEV